MKKKKEIDSIQVAGINSKITARLFLENEIKTNRMSSACMLVLAGLVTPYGIYCIFSLKNLAFSWTGWVLVVSALIELVLYLKIRSIGYEDPRTKYFIMAGLICLADVSYFLFPLVTAFIIFGPTLLSIKYYDPKLTVKITAASLLACVLAIAANVILGFYVPKVYALQLDQGMTLWTSVPYLLSYYLPLKVIVYVIEAVVGYGIAKAGRDLVLKQAAESTRAAQMSVELDTAAKIQAASLPSPSFTTPDGKMELSAYMKTARNVGGDLYDYFMLNEHLLIVTVCDVSDKGLPSAMFGVEAQSYIRFAFSEGLGRKIEGRIGDIDFEKTMNAVNRELSIHNMDEMFVTMWIGLFDTETGEGKFVNAGHNYPYIRRADGQVHSVKNDPHLFLGAFENAELTEEKLRLAPGDTLVLYTDGATDARNKADETFGEKQLKTVVGSALTESKESLPERLVKRITEKIEDFIGEQAPYDDITLLALTYGEIEK